MLPLIPLALSLAKVVPDIVGWFKGDDAKDKAEKVINLAKSITGEDEPEVAVTKILENPELALDFQKHMAQLQLEFYKEETKRMEIVNQTMRVEYESSNIFKTGWRPFIGWVLGLSLGFYIFSICGITIYSTLYQPDKVSILIDNLSKLASSLTTTWTVCMIILGVAIKKRSDDRKLAGGNQSNGLIDIITGFIKK